MNYFKVLLFLVLFLLGLLFFAGCSVGLMTTGSFGIFLVIFLFLSLLTSLVASIPACLIYFFAQRMVPLEDEVLRQVTGLFLGGLAWVVFFLVGLVGEAVYLSEPLYNLVKGF